MPATQTTASARQHSPVFLACFCLFVAVSLVGVGGVLYSIAAGTVQDWVSYWTTGHLIVRHANPYDSAAILQIERAHGLKPGIHVLIARNPPTALWAIAPLGYLRFYPGGLLWRLLQAALLALCVRLLWIHFGRTPGRWHLLAFLFIGSLACVGSGQSTIIALLGAVLFLVLLHDRPFAAGAALSLCAFKPHLFLPFVVVLLLWIIRHRAYLLILGGAAALVCQWFFAWWLDPHVLRHYLDAMRSDGIVDQFMPATAVALRFLIARHSMWLGFLPAILGSAWAAWYFIRKRQNWSWSHELPLLLVVSLLTAPYAWIVDSVLVIPAIVFTASRCSETSRTLLLLLMSAATLQYCLPANMDSPWLLWQIPAFLAWFLHAQTTIPKALVAAQPAQL